MTNFDEVNNEFISFYEAMLGTKEDVSSIKPDVIAEGSVLTVQQGSGLCKPVTASAIKSAFFSIPNAKAPRPDGFSAGFFKTTWHIIEQDVCYIPFPIYKEMRCRKNV